MTIQAIRLGCALGVAAVFFAMGARAQVSEIEPNDTCVTAQQVGSATTVTGSLDTPPVSPDVDFYRFEAPAGTYLRADLRGASSGQGTLGDPYLGLFDGACNLLAISDDFQGLDSRLEFLVPQDGTFVMAAGSCCDPDFLGNGGSAGSYTLQIGLPPPPIAGITGVIVNAVTGEPLPGDSPPYAFAYLERCNDGFCDNTIGFANAGPDGSFRFVSDFGGAPVEPGVFLVRAFADRFEATVTAKFSVGAGEEVDIGQLALQPPPISIVSVRSCDNLPTEGGVCRYSVEVTNNLAEPLGLRAWSNVNAGGTGSAFGSTVFTVGGLIRQIDVLAPQASVTLRFGFKVPAEVDDGAYFCADVWISDNPDSYYDTVESAFLFCVSKIGGSFAVESDKAVRARRGPAAIR